MTEMAESNDKDTAADNRHAATAVSGLQPLRPRARMLRILGRELISSETVAVIELVKNAYDADATHVLIRIEEEPELGGRMDVLDNGVGMELNTVLHRWLEPATGEKSRTPRTDRGRRVLGEKGIGRFAASRLADRLIVATRTAGAPGETRVTLDWTQFDNEELYLDEISIPWNVVDPSWVVPGGLLATLWGDDLPPSATTLDRGTVLRMESLRDEWDDERIRNLRSALARMVPAQVIDPDFRIRMVLPERFQLLAGDIEPATPPLDPHYRITGHVARDGSYRLQLENGRGSAGQEIVGHIKLEGGRAPHSGPFNLDLRVWDRDAGTLGEMARELGSTLKNLRKELDEQVGVAIYRDGFRVLPYGEPRNDWLRLDLRRVQNPTMRLSNNQISGQVAIGADTNPGLRDQSNREGLIEGPAFNDLREMVVTILSIVEGVRFKARRKKRDTEARRGLFDGFHLDPVREAVRERHPEDRDLLQLIADTQADLNHRVGQVKEVLGRYRRLASLGQLVDSVLHNARAPLSGVLNRADLALRKIHRGTTIDAGAVIRQLRSQAATVAAVLRRLEPLGGRRRGRAAAFQLEALVEELFSIYVDDLQRLNVRVMLPESDTRVTVAASEMHEIFHNLIRNSLYWLRRVPVDQRAIAVQIERLPEGAVEVVFSDSGPGVDPENRDTIFEPYFSLRADGEGLGLTTVGDIVSEFYGGELELLKEGPLPGATFRFTLRKRVQ